MVEHPIPMRLRWHAWEFAYVEVDLTTVDVEALTRLLGLDPADEEQRGSVLVFPDADGERYYLGVSGWPQGRLDAALARLDPAEYAVRPPEPDPEAVAIEQLWVADRVAPVLDPLRREIADLRAEVERLRGPAPEA